MALHDRGPDATDAAGKFSGSRFTRRRFVLPAIWLLSIVVAIGLAAYGVVSGAPWNPVQLLELLLLFAATWAITWLISAPQAAPPAAAPRGMGLGDGATAEWLA